MPIPVDHDHEVQRLLRAVTARAELHRLQKLRAVLAASKEGWSQRDIAASLGVTQPEVSRLAKAARLQPNVGHRTPREVLLEHAVGEVSHDDMMRELLAWDYTFGGAPTEDPDADAYVRGTWDQIERAGDLLDDDDYQQLLDATARDRAASRQ
ncbi:hypothetical protein AAFP35_18020 [Gordonia sp. CPCC 206044]|uniref:hypothetical protein n=1 Tax=Gordonia sp. CPCC 206044 TaxID=3140793 RepID=UPI003AF38506